jgi:hypothetical protein
MAQESFDTVHTSSLMIVKRLYQTGLVFLLVLNLSLFACSHPTDDETRLRQILDRMAEAIEQHDRQTIMQLLAFDFRTTQGLLPQDINRLLFVQFRQNKQIQVFLYNVDVELMPVSADVELEALLLGSSQWLPERGRRYQVQMRWQKLEEEWRLARLDWQPIMLTPEE